jgi:hypothetical protein
MSIRYHNHYSQTIHDSMRYFFNPYELHEKEVQWELEREYGSEHDPDKALPKQHGDKYIIIGSIIGAIIGGIL